MEETWKDIPGYEGLYQISNLGNVKSLIFKNKQVIYKREKILKYTIRSGYKNVNLCKNGVRISKQIHRLVAEAFIPNPENKPFVNHKDFNRQNNNVENLEWCTQKENVEWSICNMKHRKSITHSNTGEKYICKRKNTNRYRIIIDKKEYSSCKTLEKAIIKRNDILNEIDNSKK